jgi:L-seryl-tRNA(Ser) seleniumtransferase
MLTVAPDILKKRAESLAAELKPICNWSLLQVAASHAEAGSGTLPAVQIDSFAVRCLPDKWTSSRWAKALRLASIPIIGTVRDESLWLDMRTVKPDEICSIVDSVREVTSKGQS